MIRPSSMAQYFGVFLGDTDIDLEIRPVSPIGIVSIGAQIENAAFFISILASINVILATINLLPLFPLDGGHFAVALYEKITGRQADIRRLAPIAVAVVALFAFLGFVAIILDVTSPINLLVGPSRTSPSFRRRTVFFQKVGGYRYPVSFQRRQTRQLHVGGVPVGGGAPITVQSMTTTKTATSTGLSPRFTR